MSALATLRQLATETGLDARTIGRIVRDAGLVEHPGKRFDRVEAMRAVEAGQNVDLVAGHAVGGRGNVASAAISTLSRAKARSEAARADKLELDVKRRSGELLPRKAVEEAAADIIRRAQQHFMGLGPRVAPRLIAQSDPRRVAEILDDEARATLAQLADLGRLADDITAAVLA